VLGFPGMDCGMGPWFCGFPCFRVGFLFIACFSLVRGFGVFFGVVGLFLFVFGGVCGCVCFLCFWWALPFSFVVGSAVSPCRAGLSLFSVLLFFGVCGWAAA